MKFTAEGLNPQVLADKLRQLPRKDVPYVTVRALTKTAQMHRGEYARIHRVPVAAATQARSALGVSQSEFAGLPGISARTLQNWEQGITKPSGAARTLLKIAASHPNVLRSV